jgi:hypothetical protein
MPRYLVPICVAALVATLPLTEASLAGQQRSAAAKTSTVRKAWAPPKTSWGEPDLQGIWSYATVTPLERPAAQADRELLTETETAALNEDAENGPDRRAADAATDVAAAYNAFWWDRGKSTGRTSLIVDPANGKLPPLTTEGQRRRAARTAYQQAHPGDSWTDRPLAERCLVYHGVPPLPTGYNNNYQILQTPKLVAILDENIHDVRMIPLDGRPHLPAHLRQWNGDSRGHWEGDTLVVETTNYSLQTTLRFPAAPETLRAIERFTRVAPDVIDYQFTIDDPTTYTRPWSAVLPMKRIKGPIYEYACHEGNYAMAGMLRGYRVEETRKK